MLSIHTMGSPRDTPIVLVHGVTSAALTWHAVAEQLEDHFVIAIDELGHGTSPRLPEGLPAFETGCDALEETLEFVSTRVLDAPPVVVAHSMGGAMALKIAARNPALFRGLVAEDPAWLDDDQRRPYVEEGAAVAAQVRAWNERPDEAMAQAIRVNPAWSGRDVAEWVCYKTQIDPGFVEAGEVTFAEDWRVHVARLEILTLVIGSDGPDVILDAATLESLPTLNPRVRTITIPGCGHSIHREAPDAFVAAIQEFCS